MAGVTTAIVALGLMASWSWHHGRFGVLAPALTVSTSAEAGSGSSAAGAGVLRGWPSTHDSGDAVGVSANAVGALRADPLSPPVADRIEFDPALTDGLEGPSVTPPTRPQRPSSLVIPAAPAEDVWTATVPRTVLSRTAVKNAPDIAACWPLPSGVMAKLETLHDRGVATEWVQLTAACLYELHQLRSLADPRAPEALDRLSQLVVTASQQVSAAQDPNDCALLQSVAYALDRRLAIWHGVHLVSRPMMTPVSLSGSGADLAAMSRCVQEVDRQIAQLDNAGDWREYLLLDHVREMESRNWSACAAERSRLARAILTRLSAAQETPDQRQFFAEPIWETFGGDLRTWVVEPVDYGQLLDDLECLEETGSEPAGRRVAEYYQLMRWSASPMVAELGERLNTHYRNANVRVAISAELINRLLPHPATTDERVDDMLMGGRVLGRSRVSTRLNLVLFPDRQQWRMGLEAQGHVDSHTETKRGPAVFHNAGRARYLARKLLLMDHRGVRTEDAEAAAVSHASLVDLETDLDGVPLVNLLVRAIARQQYDSKLGEAKWQAEGLLADRAQTRLDEEVGKQLEVATEKFRIQVLEPLESLQLRPEAVDLETTDQRLIARYRLAGYHQVAAFTPRPQAPTDSLLSIQVHESVLNNVVSSLELNQGETDLPSLFRNIAERFRRHNYQLPEDVPTDVRLRLAEQDPIRLSCSEDRIHVTLRIARLEGGDHNVFRNFEVRASYQPDIQGLHVRLVRDGYVRIKGLRSIGDQVALRGVFSKVLAQHPQFDLLGNVLVRDTRLNDLHVTQCVVRDGWIGVSIGPGRPVKDRVADLTSESPRQ